MISIPAVHTTKIVAEGNVDLSAASELSGLARGNRANVLEGAQSVERLFEQIITGYFFPAGGGMAEEFRSLVVETDSCTFSAKRRLVMTIAEKKGLLNGADKANYDKLLAGVIRFRNAFAHGTLSSDGKKVWLSYFEGGTKKAELTDEFLRTVEVCLSNAYHETKRIFSI